MRSVCRSVGHDHEPCKTAEPIEFPFRYGIRVGGKNRVLDGGAEPAEEGSAWAVMCLVLASL